jgi:hypothetical protein
MSGGLWQYDDGFIGSWFKLSQISVVLPEQSNHVICGAIAYSQKNQFRWVSVNQRALEEIGVFGNDYESVCSRKLPDILIGRSVQVEITNMSRIRKEVGDLADDPVG